VREVFLLVKTGKVTDLVTTLGLGTRLFVKVPQPGDNEVTSELAGLSPH